MTDVPEDVYSCDCDAFRKARERFAWRAGVRKKAKRRTHRHERRRTRLELHTGEYDE